MLFYYIRHADPIYNPDSLTELGKRQAEALAKRLYMYGIDKIYCSSSNRAVLTATPTCQLHKKEMEILDFANELHAWNEISCRDENDKKRWLFQCPKYAKLFATPEIRALGKEWYEHSEFKNTGYKAGMQRIQDGCDSFLLDLGYKHDNANNVYLPINHTDQRVALFAHQGFGLAFLSCLLDIPYPEFCTHFDLGHSSMTVINFDLCDDVVIPKVLQLSNDSHLYKEGLATNYQNFIRF